MIRLVGKMAMIETAVLPMVAAALSYPPYEIYTGTTSGDPQLTYTKVCEPGRTGEANASYVILGAYSPSRPALANTSYDGAVVIPSTIGGLPVRKINDAAFIVCQKITSVQIPATVREIGARPVLAFGNSTGDSSMAAYATHGNPRRALAFMLCCDDVERENGNPAKAEKMRALCAENGWIPVSMKDDWKTIYGDGVTRRRTAP